MWKTGENWDEIYHFVVFSPSDPIRQEKLTKALSLAQY
jgi:hypothetical protein